MSCDIINKRIRTVTFMAKREWYKPKLCIICENAQAVTLKCSNCRRWGFCEGCIDEIRYTLTYPDSPWRNRGPIGGALCYECSEEDWIDYQQRGEDPVPEVDIEIVG
tara:strand:- start:150 stop:470 length:321 start_codon:yes stop_codon:yes gene_type:complete